MKKIIFGFAVAFAAIFGGYTASQTSETPMSDLQVEDVEALAAGDTYRAVRYGDCVYYKCNEGGNYNPTNVWVECEKSASIGLASVTEITTVQLRKCFAGGVDCYEEDCLKYFILLQR